MDKALTETDIECVLELARNNMNVRAASQKMFRHRNTVLYHLERVKQITGKDPRDFFELVELVQEYDR